MQWSSDLSHWSPWHIGHHKSSNKRPCSSLGSGKVLVVDLCRMSFGSRAQGDVGWAAAWRPTEEFVVWEAAPGATTGGCWCATWRPVSGTAGKAPVNGDLRLQAHIAKSTSLVSAIVTCHNPDEPPAETTRPRIDLGVRRHIYLTRHSHTCRVSATRYTGRGHRWGLASCSTCHLRVERKTRRRRRREKKSQSCVSNRGTAQCAKSRWGAHSSTWCQLPWGSGHVKARSTRVTRAHTRGHWWTRPGSKARVATAARTTMAGPSRSRVNWSSETLPTNMKGRSGTLGEQSTLDKGLTDVRRSTTPRGDSFIARIKSITKIGMKVVPCQAIIRAMTGHQAVGWGQATPRLYIIMDTIMRMGGHITLGGHGRTIPGRSRWEIWRCWRIYRIIYIAGRAEWVIMWVHIQLKVLQETAKSS